MTLSCDMAKYPSCPPHFQGYQKSNNAETTIHHVKDRLMTMDIGSNPIILQKRKRDFTIHYKNYTQWDGVSIIFDPGESVSLQCNGSISTIFTADVSEYYQCIDSVLYFLDRRYNNAVIKETDQILTFSKGPTDEAARFKGEWGIGDFHKLKIDNGQIREKVTWYLIAKGEKRILKSSETVNHINIPILIFPFPPSMSIPQDPEVKALGFYDYFGTGEGGADLKMAQDDGGQDFYFPEWCRRIGRANQALDVQEAMDRFSAVFLHETPPVNQSMAMPTIAMDGNFKGSMTVDLFGNLFYSIEIDGEIYNHLDGVEDTEIATLVGIEGTNPKFYPIGLL